MGESSEELVQVDVGGFTDVPAERIAEAVRRTLEAGGRSDIEISIALLDDEEMRELHRKYLGRDSTTDVLSFSLGAGEETVGDVYIGLEQARRQAGDLEVSLLEELARLAIHGTLHVLGHDHPEGAERELSPMFQLQERLLAEQLGGLSNG